MTSLTETLTPNYNHPSHWRQVLAAVALGTLAAVAILWSWNEVAVALFGAPPAQFKHAVAPVAALALLCWMLRMIWRAPSGDHQRFSA